MVENVHRNPAKLRLNLFYRLVQLTDILVNSFVHVRMLQPAYEAGEREVEHVLVLKGAREARGVRVVVRRAEQSRDR